MFCGNCGYELNSQDNFCPKCGKKVSESITQAEVLAEASVEEQLASGKLLFVNPETHAKSYIQIDEAKAKAMNAECKDDDYYINLIDNWEINPQVKEICKALISMTRTIGGYVVRIGKWVFNIVKNLAEQIVSRFPNMLIGAAIGFAFGLVFSSIPLLGWILGGFVTPLLTMGGGALGLLVDAQSSVIVKKVTSEVLSKYGITA